MIHNLDEASKIQCFFSAPRKLCIFISFTISTSLNLIIFCFFKCLTIFPSGIATISQPSVSPVSLG